MKELVRLLRYVRRYVPALLASIALMAGVGAAHGLMPVLMGVVFDRVLNPAAGDTPVDLFTVPFTKLTLTLNDFIPASIHNVWTMIATAILVVFLLRGLFDYLGTYLINHVGLSVVTDLRQTVFDKVLRHGAEFFESHSTGRLMSSIMNDIDKIQVATSHILADLLRQFFMAVGLLLRHVAQGLAAGGGEPDRAALRAGAHGAHRQAHPAHHPPGAGRHGGSEPDPAGGPQRPPGGAGFRGRGVRVAPLPHRLQPAALEQPALRRPAGHGFAADRVLRRHHDRRPAHLCPEPDSEPGT